MVINGFESIQKEFGHIDTLEFDVDDDKIDSMPIEDLEKYIAVFDSNYKEAIESLKKIRSFLSDENISGGRKESLLKECDLRESDIKGLYKDNRKILLLSHQLKKTNKKLENSLGLQFGIFSAVLSVLSFVLNNSKLLAYESISFRNVLLINLSHILACAVMFYFAMWFIKPYKHSKGRVWTLTLIIIAISVLLFLVAKKAINI